MLLEDTQSAPTAAVSLAGCPRGNDVAEALDRYMARYVPEHRHSPRVVRQLAALAIEALEGLGSAMSGGGRFPPVGVM